MADEIFTGCLRTLIYWTIPESSLKTISACLRTHRPIFQCHSLESIIKSIRSHISLSSGKTPKQLKSVEIERKFSTVSSVGLKNASENVDGYIGVENETNILSLREMVTAKYPRNDAITVLMTYGRVIAKSK